MGVSMYATATALEGGKLCFLGTFLIPVIMRLIKFVILINIYKH